MCHSGRTRIAVGFFDGVHLGHRAILADADIAVTFRGHPREILAPNSAPKLILSLEERVRAIHSAGVKDVEVLDFSDRLAAMSPEEFVKILSDISVSRGGTKEIEIKCGPDWRFGAKGAGTPETLLNLGLSVTVAPFAEYAGERVSSTRIRKSIESGAIEEASAMMGRPFVVSGTLFRGKGEGGAMGFPTLNVRVNNEERMVMPPFGVYAVDRAGVRAIANFGFAPTMGERAWKKPVWEIHFLSQVSEMADEEGDEIVFSPIRFIRPERTFNSICDLRKQIAADCKEVCK